MLCFNCVMLKRGTKKVITKNHLCGQIKVKLSAITVLKLKRCELFLRKINKWHVKSCT